MKVSDFINEESISRLKDRCEKLIQDNEDLRTAIAELNCYCGPYEAGFTCDVCELRDDFKIKPKSQSDE